MQMSPQELEQRRRAANPPKDPCAELLEAGQEEVFSRTEVEAGRIEHAAGDHHSPRETRQPTLAERDEAQTERQAPEDASPGETAGGA
jgi:hypothetical protein